MLKTKEVVAGQAYRKRKARRLIKTADVTLNTKANYIKAKTAEVVKDGIIKSSACIRTDRNEKMLFFPSVVPKTQEQAVLLDARKSIYLAIRN